MESIVITVPSSTKNYFPYASSEGYDIGAYTIEEIYGYFVNTYLVDPVTFSDYSGWDGGARSSAYRRCYFRNVLPAPCFPSVHLQELGQRNPYLAA